MSDDADLVEAAVATIPEEIGRYADLVPHPENYQSHPPDQIEHLKASIREFGIFKNVVVARDGMLLAGHGTVEAALALDPDFEGPLRRLDLDPYSAPARKVLALDNEVGRIAERDDRALTELLRAVSESDSGLLGTGYDDANLALLVMVTRPAHEIATIDAAAEWVGMPDYTPEGEVWKLVVQFTSESDRDRFVEEQKIRDLVHVSKITSHAISAWWPKPNEVRHDSSLRWEDASDGEAAAG